VIAGTIPASRHEKRDHDGGLFAQSRLATEILTTYLKDAYQGPPGA
jgi:hypothetical protein